VLERSGGVAATLRYRVQGVNRLYALFFELRTRSTADTIVPMTASAMKTPTTIWNVGVLIHRRIPLP
jgi:hypothetical protein